jgi:hypothetical protein
MTDIEDIPHIPDRAKRIEEVTVDCYGQEEELTAFEVYLSEAMQFPFSATWRDLDEPDHAEQVTVLAADEFDERRGVLLKVRLERTGKQRCVVAEQIWADDPSSVNATVLDDYRYWVNNMYGLTPGYD